MSALPDPDALDAMASRIFAHAQAARSRAAVLNGAIAATTWRGTAAVVFADHANGVAMGLRTAAGQLDEAAEALHRHAARVRENVDIIVRFEHSIAETAVDVGLAAVRAAPTALHLLHDAGAVTIGPLGGIAHLLGID